MLVEAQLDLLNTGDWDHLLEYDVDLTDIQTPHQQRQQDEDEAASTDSNSAY